MDLSQLTSATSSSGVQGMGGGHHHHHKSISDQVSQMSSAISNAVQAGTMSSSQATTLQNELKDITTTLSQTSQTSATSTTGSTSTTNPLSQLSDADRKKVFGELQDVRKQLSAVGATSSTSSTSSSSSTDAVNKLFAQIDTDSNGSIDQAEFTQFLAQVGASALGYNQQGTSSSMFSGITGSNFSVTG